jgi:UDP-N-acetylglucosamine--N-acetylmuramyl-(pentapeptide) pyrophosphoryl-undecaprenol N-acetylglucosamine transferase
MNRQHAVTKRRPVLIMAGGTGGHVFPALAVAHELLQVGVPVVWLGTRKGLEARVIPEADIPMQWVKVSGLRGQGIAKLFTAPFMLTVALWQVFVVMLRIRPAVVLGMGGFVTGPGGLMASLLRRPLLIHEQNSVAGMTNRWLAHFATQVMEAFPGTLPGAIHTGNPVRTDITDLPPPADRLAGRSGRLRVLVLGGSLGAQVLNETLPKALAQLDDAVRPEVMHQTGTRTHAAAADAYRAAGVEVRLEPFIEDMASAYAWADIVICRAGALTIAELAAAGIGSVLVPYPLAVDDHQTGNARFLEDADAAILLPQTELEPTRLATLLAGLVARRERLLEMAQAARRLAMPDAARRVTALCLAAAGILPGNGGQPA